MGEVVAVLRVEVVEQALGIEGAEDPLADDVLELVGGHPTVQCVRGDQLDVADAGHFRQDLLPPGTQPELAVTRHYAPTAPFNIANGIQAALVEVDIDTGFVRPLRHWVVEDCGRVINPLLVDEQIRGGVVQGIGGALFEHCIYDDDANLLNGTLADYLVPMAAEMPDIEIGHWSREHSSAPRAQARRARLVRQRPFYAR